jgi:hypothetical protein
MLRGSGIQKKTYRGSGSGGTKAPDPESGFATLPAFCCVATKLPPRS